MTNKPTWEDELKTLCEKYCNCIDAYTGRHMIDPSCTYHQVWEEGIIEQFISTKIAKQRKEIIEKIEKQEMPQYQDDGAEHAHAGYVKALEDVINLIKQD